MKLFSDRNLQLTQTTDKPNEVKYSKTTERDNHITSSSNDLNALMLDISEIKTAPEDDEPDQESFRNSKNELMETLKLCHLGSSSQQLTRVKTRNYLSQRNFHSVALMSPSTMVSTTPSLNDLASPKTVKLAKSQQEFLPKKNKFSSAGKEYAFGDKLEANLFFLKHNDQQNTGITMNLWPSSARTSDIKKLRKSFSSQFRLSRYKDPKDVNKFEILNEDNNENPLIARKNDGPFLKSSLEEKESNKIFRENSKILANASSKNPSRKVPKSDTIKAGSFSQIKNLKNSFSRSHILVKKDNQNEKDGFKVLVAKKKNARL